MDTQSGTEYTVDTQSGTEHSVSQCTAGTGGHEGNTAFTPSYSHDGDDDDCDEEEEEEKKDIFEMKL